MDRRLAGRFACGAYYVLYALFYAGWFFQRSLQQYPVRFAALLVLLAGGFFVPPLIARAVGKLGRRRAGFAAAAVSLVMALLYGGASLAYYYTRLHPFDPLLQKPPALLEEYPREKPAGTFRVLALGGSTTANRDMPLEERYPTQLERLLQARHPSRPMEVINAGKGWYTTQHSLVNYVSYCRDWQPDLVVVMHGINDLCRSFAPPRYSLGEYNRRWSHFYGPSIRGAKPPTFEGAWFEETFAKSWYESLRVRPRDVPLEEFRSLPEFERNLSALVHYLHADGCRVLLVTQPSMYKSEMTAEEAQTLWFGRTFCVEAEGFWHQRYASPGSLRRAMDAYNAAVRRVGEAAGVPVAEGDPAVPRDLSHFRDDVHYTAAGARKVAEAVARQIEASRLAEPAGRLGMK